MFCLQIRSALESSIRDFNELSGDILRRLQIKTNHEGQTYLLNVNETGFKPLVTFTERKTPEQYRWILLSGNRYCRKIFVIEQYDRRR